MHLSFTREIRNLRVNSSAQRQLALQFANSALNNTVPRETLVRSAVTMECDRFVKVLINLSCRTSIRFSRFIILVLWFALYSIEMSRVRTIQIFEVMIERFMYAIIHGRRIRHVRTYLLRIDGWSFYTSYPALK